MAHTASKMMMWVQSFLYEMRIMIHIPIKMNFDNQSTIFIASNLVFHERTKHIEVNCNFIRDLVIKKQIVTYVRSKDRLGDILTKHLPIVYFLFYIASWACLIYMLQLKRMLELLVLFS